MALRAWLSGAALGALLAGVPAGLGQQARTIENLISRPSARGPSAYLGGRFTTAPDLSPMQVPQRQVATLGERVFEFRPTARPSQYQFGFTPTQLGLREPLTAGGAGPRLFGMQTPRTLGGEMPMRRLGLLPAIDAHVFTPRPETTRFHELVGLTPARAAEGAPVRPMAERVEARTQERVERARAEGLALFRNATVEPLVMDPRTGATRYPNCQDCTANLVRAAQKLELVQQLDEGDAVALVLLAHAMLEQGRPMAAGSYLLKAWRRDPELLAEPAAIDEYFGDVAGAGGRSEYLSAQMRRYVRLGELNPASPLAHAMEAYCAWRLGDRYRLEAAAARAQELAQADPETHGVVLRFTAALLSAR